MTYSLTWLPKVLRAAGLTVVEIDGWQTRGHGDMGVIQGALLHHTAERIDSDTKPVLKILTEGRAASPGVKSLYGPLCHLALGQDGIYYVIAAGLAYHAGPGSWHGVIDGNKHFIGIEAENNGIGETWPEIQLDAFARGSAAIAVYCDFGVIMVAGHKEYALPLGRKIDPNFDMNAFRLRVYKYMIAPRVTPIAIPPVDIVAMRAAAKMILMAADEIEYLRNKSKL
jgi:hypothetical protein